MTQKQRIMYNLKCTEEEAEEILAMDKEIDKGNRVYFDMSKEEEKEAKKFINVDTKKKPIIFDNKPRERKPNEEKGFLITSLNDFLENADIGIENLKITNKERQIAFSVGDNDYELTLVQKRKPKAK